MAFSLGNFSVDEILYAVAEHDYGTGEQIVYTLDQLNQASIEISSESTEIVDKRGNVVRTIYKNKTGTFSATNAFLNPHMINASSGASIEYASEANPIAAVPRFEIIEAKEAAFSYVLLSEGTASMTTSVDANVDDASIEVIGIQGNGANVALTKVESGTPAAGQWAYATGSNTVTVGPKAETGIVKYLIKYERTIKDGMKLVNSANEFPETVKLTLFCSIVDPCDDDLKAAYIVLPSFQASPETTISLNSDEQEMDFSGNLQLNLTYASAA